MCTGGMAPNTDAVGIQMQLLGLSPQVPYGALAVVKWLGKLHTAGRQAVVDAHAAVPALDERNKLVGTLILRARTPAAAMDVDDHRQRLIGQLLRPINVQLQIDV